MDKQSSSVLARALGLVGVLFILAMAFDVMPRRYALFAGVACFIAGSLWGIGGQKD